MQSITFQLQQEFKRVIKELGYEDRPITFELSKNIKYGDICTNVAFQIASEYKKNPYEIAKQITNNLQKLEYFEKVNPEKNGFINLFYSPSVYQKYHKNILDKKEKIGMQENKKEWRFVEIVSANPTGYLHIGHARNGIFSDTLSNLLEYNGYSIYREYLVNNFGNQIKELIDSIWTKYRIKFFEPGIDLKEYATVKYNGSEIDECVEYLIQRYKEEWMADPNIFNSPIYSKVEKVILEYFLNEIKKDLKTYQIEVKSWRHEKDFVNNLNINELLKSIEKYLVYRDGAVWFKVGELEKNQKDEVLIKKDGLHTYFCQDLIYHSHKLRLLGAKDKIINVLGSDHQGHIGRMKGFLKAINIPESKIDFVTIQLVTLHEDNKTVKMSKRKSNVVHIKDLENFMTYEEVRWFFVSQPANSPLEIDIEKLKSKDYNNPVFYVMYAYSRISKIFSKLKDQESYKKKIEFKNITEREKNLWNLLLSYEETIVNASATLSPHKIPQYLFKLAQMFHSYYEEVNILGITDKGELNEKLALLNAIKTTIFSGLSIMKIKAKNEL